MNATTTEFDWQATESAPINYPMQIIDGTFFYHEQQNGLYIPSGGTLYDGWGKMISSHVVGDDLKPLPDRLEITFFSYTENVFYQGTFDLPYEKILAFFNAGYFSPREKGDTTYEGIMCGIAPGGTVVVWLLGIDKITEVFTGQANKIEANEKLNDVIPPELVKMELENEDSIEPGVLTSMRENGIPFANWATQFRTKYKWVPTFVTENSPKEINPIFYLNGEQDYLFYPLAEEISAATRPVPEEMNFVYESPKGWSYLYIIHFNETEMLDVFTRLGSNQQSLQLEFDLQMPIDLTTIRLRNGKDAITLKKFSIEKID